MSLDSEIRFRSAADRAAFSKHRTKAEATLVSRYLNESAPGGRLPRLMVVACRRPHNSQLRRSHLGRTIRGAGTNAPPASEDIARIIVGAIEQPDRHAGKTYRPTGPELLTPQQTVDHIRVALGRRVKYRPMSDRMFLQALKADRRPIFMHRQLRTGITHEPSAIPRDATATPFGSNVSCIQSTGIVIRLQAVDLCRFTCLLGGPEPQPKRPGVRTNLQ